MSEVLLDSPRVLPVVGEFVAGRMTQHVRVDGKREARLPSGAGYDLAHRMRRQRSLALTHEHIGRARLFPLQAAQRAQFRAAQRMHGSQAVLEPGDVHQALSKIDLVPAQTHQFRYPQAVAVADQDQGRIAKSMTSLRCRRGDDLPDLLFRQIFPVAIFGVGAAPGNFPFYDGWGSRDGTLAIPLFVQGEAPNFPLFIHSMESFRPFITLTDPPHFQCAPAASTRCATCGTRSYNATCIVPRTASSRIINSALSSRRLAAKSI